MIFIEDICAKCAEYPKSHSLEYRGRICEPPHYDIWYSCPGNAIEYDDHHGIMNHYRNAFQTIQHPWVWIFDAHGFSWEHALCVRTAIGIAQLLASHSYLEEIRIRNSNSYLNSILYITKPFLGERLRNKIIIESSHIH